MISGLLASTGDLVGAREGFDAAIALDASNIVSYIGLARLDANERNYAAAEKNYRAAHELAPDNADLMISMGKLRALQNDQQGMVEWLQKAVDADPKNVEAQSFLARAYVISRDFESAIDAATAGLALSPDDAELHSTLGFAQAPHVAIAP